MRICRSCRQRQIETADFLSAFRELREVPLDVTHCTDIGPIRLAVSKSGCGVWEARFAGQEHDQPKCFATLPEANDFLLECFRRMFPGHECDERCA